MGDSRYLTSAIVLDASPLIYLAKLEALDVLTVATGAALVTPTVLEEVTRPQIAYRHPDAVEVEQAIERGEIGVVTLTQAEHDAAVDMTKRVPGLDPGETEVLAVAISRTIPAVIFERRARRVARALGANLVGVVELLVAGTDDAVLREERIVRFARLVDMRLDDAVELLARIRSRRLGRTTGADDE